MATRTYGDGLRRILADAGLSQTDFAEALGVTRQTVNAYTAPDLERRKTPNDERKRQISEYLGMSAHEIERAATREGAGPRTQQHNSSAAKTHQENARRAFARRLAEHGSTFVRGLRRTIEAPGFDALQFDYADNDLTLLLTFRTHRASTLYEALWTLFKMREMTRRVGVDRRAVLAVIDSPGVADLYVNDAELAGVDLLEFDSPEQLADWVAKQATAGAG